MNPQPFAGDKSVAHVSIGSLPVAALMKKVDGHSGDPDGKAMKELTHVLVHEPIRIPGHFY